MAQTRFSPEFLTRQSEDGVWHILQPEEIADRLQTHFERGLSQEEVEQRLKAVGPNVLQEPPPTSFWQMLLDQFDNFVVIMLIVASLISAALGDWIESAAIISIVVLNATLGVIQEWRAEQALAALRKLAAPEAHVIRNGSRQMIPASQLVPGDIVLLEAGNYVPADLRLLEAVNLQIEEAALTGESVPVQKHAATLQEKDLPIGDRKNSAFMGTLVSYGRGRGVVTATGMGTQIGLIAAMLQSVQHEPTPLQKRLDQLGKTLGWAAIAICALVFLLGWLRGYPPLEMFMIAVGLAIAAVPEGLPAVVTISLALGMREMVRRHALIRRLSSVETLGSATVICSDKTGTLTQNEMTVTRIWADGVFFEVSGSGYSPQGEFYVDGKPIDPQQYQALLTALWVGCLNNDAELEEIESSDSEVPYRMVGDPTEGALLVAALKAKADLKGLRHAYPRVQEIPFDSERKRMVTVHALHHPREEDISPFDTTDSQKGYVVLVKGAPDIVLNLCTHCQNMQDYAVPLREEKRRQILQANDRMTQEALRVLGVAYKLLPELPAALDPAELERGMTFVGLLGMIDPPRPEVMPALEKARRAGIRTIMITGDYPNTARAIAESIKLLLPGHQVLTGSQLDTMDDLELQRQIRSTDVFARVSPEHKLRIVEALRANDEVVAMTGDGVNDAPAIKRADIGIAMGITGTDVAKESADMVLTDDNYASIVAAIEQGRVIYSNIRKFVFFLLSSNVAEIMIIFLATLAGVPTPLTVVQLLMLNLITDGAPALALAMEKGDPDIMERPPRPRNEPIVHKPMRLGILIQTLAQTAVTLTAFAIGLLWHLAEGDVLPPGVNPLVFLLSYDWRGVDVQTAETMAFVTLSLCELFRAYTVRSERQSVFRIGLFSNRSMQYAVAFSLSVLALVISVPFLQPIFNTHFMSLREWVVVVSLAMIPAAAEEITKFFLRLAERRPLQKR
ncbi:MAG: cation-translocating P-type ATPase [Anaerolineales bacterium]|nr:cation-translocating P-type ATPase [Anaerolineales bacterium]MDW8161187.1 cation-translocating P-type ATPase [Anaerolineales bacterium]